jgi:hypothetical protein
MAYNRDTFTFYQYSILIYHHPLRCPTALTCRPEKRGRREEPHSGTDIFLKYDTSLMLYEGATIVHNNDARRNEFTELQ